MNAQKVLDPALKDILEVISPAREHWALRFSIIEELRSVVHTIDCFRGASVEPFGSFASNLFSCWGDLDICIQLMNGLYISKAGRKQKQSLLEELIKYLAQRGQWCKLQYLPNARVPILKLQSSLGIACDISIDNIQGISKSKFLFWLSEIDGRFRDMVLLVKEWAKANKINNPKAGTLNSYSLTLLVVFHFQTCVPAILPPLKAIYPSNVADELSGRRSEVEERIEEACRKNIATYMSDRSRKLNRSSLAELFVSFLAKFSDINVKTKEVGICPFSGQWEDINNNMRWMPRTYTIFIEDPFEQPQNTAKGVGAKTVDKISEAFRRSHQRLLSANHFHHSLLDTLVRPRVLNLIVGKPWMASIYRGYGRGMHPPRTRQDRYPHNLAEENQSYHMTKQTPMQQHHHQPKQIWRPKSNTQGDAQMQ